MSSCPTTTAIPCASASAYQSEFAPLYPFSAPDGRGSQLLRGSVANCSDRWEEIFGDFTTVCRS
jgi:hypothetical protein